MDEEGNCAAEPNPVASETLHASLVVVSSLPAVDTDHDGIADSADNCPATPNPDQANTNYSDSPDGGDACDSKDSDNDGLRDFEELSSFWNTSATDADSDGDGVIDGIDPNPITP